MYRAIDRLRAGESYRVAAPLAAMVREPVRVYGRDRFASTGKGISSAGSRIIPYETIDQTESGTGWLTMFTFLRLQLKYIIG